MTAETEILQMLSGSLELARPGGRGLRAWDAADELLIETALEYATPGCRLLIVDDNYGALSLALNPLAPDIIADNATLTAALQRNADINALAASVPMSWADTVDGHYDLIVMRIPRQVDYLEYLLRWANGVLKPGGKLIAGGMIKHLPERSAVIFERLLETQQVLPARKKARVVVCGAGEATLLSWEGLWQGYDAPGWQGRVEALPAVFSRDRLDHGTRLFLDQVKRVVADLEPGARVLDLACGNGVVGAAVLVQRPDVVVVFSDVSSQAVASAQRNVESIKGSVDVTFHHCDGVPKDAGTYDLILLNPPFHEGGTVGDHIALRLFQGAGRHLLATGQLLIVGNRHLGYHKTLRRYFLKVSQCSADPKFVVFSAQRSGRL